MQSYFSTDESILSLGLPFDLWIGSFPSSHFKECLSGNKLSTETHAKPVAANGMAT